jgi:hypothetical protein
MAQSFHAYLGTFLATKTEESKNAAIGAFCNYIYSIRESTYATNAEDVDPIVETFNQLWAAGKPIDKSKIKPHPPAVSTAESTLVQIRQLKPYMQQMSRIIQNNTAITTALRDYITYTQTVRIDEKEYKESHPDDTKTFKIHVAPTTDGAKIINVDETPSIIPDAPTDTSYVGDITITGTYAVTTTAQTVLDLVWANANHFKEIHLNGQRSPTKETTEICIVPGGISANSTHKQQRASMAPLSVTPCTARCLLAMLRHTEQPEINIIDCTIPDLVYIAHGIQFSKIKRIGLPGIVINHVPSGVWRAIKGNPEIEGIT